MDLRDKSIKRAVWFLLYTALSLHGTNGWTSFVLRSPHRSSNLRSTSYHYQPPSQSLLEARTGLRTPPKSWFGNIIESFFRPILQWTSRNPNDYYSNLDRRAANSDYQRPPTNYVSLPPDVPNPTTYHTYARSPLLSWSMNDRYRMPYRTQPAPYFVPVISPSTTTRPSPMREAGLFLSQMPFYIRRRNFILPPILPYAAPPVTLPTTTVSSIPETVNVPLISPQQDVCAPKQYRTPLQCPQKYGFFKLGSSCYYISSIRSQMNAHPLYTLDESRHQCSSLNDLTGQSQGDWHLLVINDEKELNAISPALNLAMGTTEHTSPTTSAHIWIDQVRPASSADEARRLGSPYIYTVPCAGAATYLAPIDNFAPNQLEDAIRTPLGCNIGTNVAGELHVDPATCERMRLNFVCELDLDGDPSSAFHEDEVPISKDNSLRRRAAATWWVQAVRRRKF